jgi:conjugative transposon TraM protein
MKINVNQPKYVIPLLILPFLFLFFYILHSGKFKPPQRVKQAPVLNGNVGEVSAGVRKKQLSDKLDAYRNTFKQADGYTAVTIIPKEPATSPAFKDRYSANEKRHLDSIDRVMKAKNIISADAGHDKLVAAALTKIARKQPPLVKETHLEPDPMSLFKQQMSYMDSVSKHNDPAFKAEKLRKQAADRALQQKASEVKFTVSKVDDNVDDFNTVRPKHQSLFISAVVDENLTGYAGSRLRIKLMEDIQAGGNIVKKGTYLFAQISGFATQRVMLNISTILSEGKILPVKLEVYDLDGLPGLYVPASAYREFTKDLGTSTVQGVALDGNNDGSQFLMSSVKKLFQSSSTAIADLIKKNKVKLKYNSCLYLIDKDALQKIQQTY